VVGEKDVEAPMLNAEEAEMWAGCGGSGFEIRAELIIKARGGGGGELGVGAARGESVRALSVGPVAL